MSDHQTEHGQAEHRHEGNGAAPPATLAVAATKPRVINTSIVDGIVTVNHTSHGGPLAQFDASQLVGHPIARDLIAYAVSILLRNAATDEDPHKGVREMTAKLLEGNWQPGRRAVVTEPEPVVEALAQHLNKDVRFVTETYLPRYCQHKGLISSNGRTMVARAKAELERHKDIAPLVARIVTQRARAGKGAESLNLNSVLGDEGETTAHAAE